MLTSGIPKFPCFQHNKEREDKHRLQEKQKKGLLPMDDDDSSSEEEVTMMHRPRRSIAQCITLNLAQGEILVQSGPPCDTAAAQKQCLRVNRTRGQSSPRRR